MATIDPFVFYAELALGATVTGQPNSWSWTEVTDYVGQPAISITRGRSDRYADAQPDQCAIAFLNNNGRFVPRNALGPYYGQLRRGTPLRIMIRPNINSASDAFARTAASSWGSADVGGTWTNVGTAGDYSVSAASGGRHTNNAATVNHWSTLAFSLSRVDVKVRVRVNALSTGGPQQAGVTARFVDASNNRRAELSFAVGGAVTLRLVARTAGADTVLTSVTAPFTHSTSTWYWVRLQTGLSTGRVKAWQDGTTEPATWNIDGLAGILLNPVAGAVGVISRRDTGNTNAAATTDFDDFSLVDGPRIQFTGFVDDWPVTWADHALTQSYAPVTASGQLRRLGRAQPLKSAVYIATSGSSGLVGYWPMEDGAGAMTFASASGGTPGTFSNVQLAASSGLAGSDPLPTLGVTGRIAFQVPPYTSSGQWAVCWVMRVPAASLSGAAQIMSWTTPSGSISRWQLRLQPGTPDTVSVDGFAPGGGVSTGATANFVDGVSGAELSDGRQLAFLVTGTTNGANVDVAWTCWYVPDNGGLVTAAVGSYSPVATTGRVSLIYHDSVTGFAGGGHTIGHVALGDGNLSFGPGAIGASGGSGQTTGERFQALLATQGIVSLIGDLVHGGLPPTQQMGPQRTGDVLAQLREVGDTEGGIVHDSKQGFLEMLPRASRYNRPVDLALDVDLGDVGWPFAATDDAYLLRNDVTVTNTGGSAARSTDPASIALQGVYADSDQVSVYNGTDLQQHADWRRFLGTTGAGLRYPQIVVNMTSRHLALANSWLDTDVGSRVTVAHVPANELPPEDLDLLVDGYTETISSTEWTVLLNCSPGSQWLTGLLDDTTPRLDCGASTIIAALTTSQTSVEVLHTDECDWTHDYGDYPVYIGGERMTVTAVTADAGDTFARTSSSSWGSNPTTGVAYVVSGTASDYAVTAGVGTQSNGTVGTLRTSFLDIGSSNVDLTVDVSVPVASALTQPITQWVCGRLTDGSNHYIARLDLTVGVTSLGIWKRVGGVLTNLVAQATVGTGHVSGESWRVRLQVIGSTIQAKAWLAAGTEPYAFQASATDTDLTTGFQIGFLSRLETGNTNGLPVIIAWDNVSVLNPQRLTVTRTVNGISKTHSAGEEVHVAVPIIVAL